MESRYSAVSNGHAPFKLRQFLTSLELLTLVLVSDWKETPEVKRIKAAAILTIVHYKSKVSRILRCISFSQNLERHPYFQTVFDYFKFEQNVFDDC